MIDFTFASEGLNNYKGSEKKKTIYYDNKSVTVHDGYLDIGLIDTMEDLEVNFVGAIIFSVLGYFYIKQRDKYKGIEHFIPRKKKA